MTTQSEVRPFSTHRSHPQSREGPGQRRLSAIVKASWRRCIEEYGLEPEDRSAPPVLEQHEIAERRDRLDEVLAVAQAEMDQLHQRMHGSGFSLVLTDTDGVILRSLWDDQVDSPTQDHPLRTGSVWSEAIQGTNGIGTCLVEGVPVTIHRRDHFLTRNSSLTCTGAPILGPEGEPRAVLDASGTATEAQSHTRALIRIASQSIENQLLLRLHAEDYILRFHEQGELVFSGNEALLVLDENGNVMGANLNAVHQTGHFSHDDLLGKNVERLFNTRVNDLLSSGCVQTLRPQAMPSRGEGHSPKASLMLPRSQKGPVSAVSTPAPAARRRRGRSKNQEETSALDALSFGDPTMDYNIRAAKRIVEQDVPLLLHGETGTGKEAFSKAIHEASSRGDQPFVAVNCAAIPESLIESELFGYRPGAFTGASRAGYQGKIAQADGGTLFLDEIGDMPVQLQARLLRVLETKEVIPLGGTKPEQVDLRVIAATHRSVRQLIGDGLFREDLYYRLAGVTLTLPPLRERQDKPQLIEHIIRMECGAREISVSPEVLETFRRGPWPGNIRQLRLVTRTALAMADDGYVETAHLPPELFNELKDDADHGRFDGDAPAAAPSTATGGDTGAGTAEEAAEDDDTNPLEAAERAALIRELERNRWNITRVSRKLKVCRNTLYRKMRRYNISPPQDD